MHSLTKLAFSQTFMKNILNSLANVYVSLRICACSHKHLKFSRIFWVLSQTFKFPQEYLVFFRKLLCFPEYFACSYKHLCFSWKYLEFSHKHLHSSRIFCFLHLWGICLYWHIVSVVLFNTYCTVLTHFVLILSEIKERDNTMQSITIVFSSP